MKTNVFLIVLLTINLIAKAQVIEILDELHFHKMINPDNTVSNTYDNIAGSPYLTENFVESTVYFRNDSAYKIALRYNIFDNRMEYEYKGLVYSVSNPRDIYKIIMDDKVFIYYFSKVNLGFEGWYQLLADGKAILLLKQDIAFREKEKPDGITTPKPDRFVRNPDKYYVVIGSEPPKQLKNKKSIPLIFKDKAKEMSTFAKKEKISFRKKEDLVRLVKHYNSL